MSMDERVEVLASSEQRAGRTRRSLAVATVVLISNACSSDATRGRSVATESEGTEDTSNTSSWAATHSATSETPTSGQSTANTSSLVTNTSATAANTNSLPTTDVSSAETNETTTSEASSSEETSTSGTSEASECELATVLPPDATGSVLFDLRLVSGGAALETGEEYVDADDIPYSLSYLGLFLSAPAFTTAEGDAVSATFIDEAGMPMPYGVYFVDTANPASTMRLVAPPGEYTAVTFELGVPLGCASGDALGREPPLDVGSPLRWTWGEAYMTLRLEGSTGASAAEPFSLHLGRLLSSPLANASISIPHVVVVEPTAADPTYVLKLDVARVLAPRPEDAAMGIHSTQADWLMLNLVENAFSLEALDSNAP